VVAAVDKSRRISQIITAGCVVRNVRGRRFDPGPLNIVRRFVVAARNAGSQLLRRGVTASGKFWQTTLVQAKGVTTPPNRETASKSRFRQSVDVFKANYRTNIRANQGARNATNRPESLSLLPRFRGLCIQCKNILGGFPRYSCFGMCAVTSAGGGISGQCSCPLLRGLRDEGFHGRPK
jgi:hypothetical protein